MGVTKRLTQSGSLKEPCAIGPEEGDSAQRKQQRGRDIIYLGNFEQYNAEIEWVDSLRNELRRRSSAEFESGKSSIESLVAPKAFTLDEVLVELQK